MGSRGVCHCPGEDAAGLAPGAVPGLWCGPTTRNAGRRLGCRRKWAVPLSRRCGGAGGCWNGRWSQEYPSAGLLETRFMGNDRPPAAVAGAIEEFLTVLATRAMEKLWAFQEQDRRQVGRDSPCGPTGWRLGEESGWVTDRLSAGDGAKRPRRLGLGTSSPGHKGAWQGVLASGPAQRSQA